MPVPGHRLNPTRNDVEPQPAGADRRRAPGPAFILAGLGLLAGCAHRTATMLPPPAWPADQTPAAADETYAEIVAPAATPTEPEGPGPILPRGEWARGRPIPVLMKPMTTIRFITVHHDGMEPFAATNRQSVAEHLETIRTLHRNQGWGDIGYHYAVDRAGRVWEARPLRYQGAHVKDRNPGNIGIVALGNFDEQFPSDAQLEALNRHVHRLMRTYRVPVSRVLTHQEWSPTACPGKHLQRYLVDLRENGELAKKVLGSRGREGTESGSHLVTQ